MASADTLVIDVNPSSGGSLELRLPGLGQENLDL
jgi:hypothetical protein